MTDIKLCYYYLYDCTQVMIEHKYNYGDCLTFKINFKVMRD
jgi:hypothetical protein